MHPEVSPTVDRRRIQVTEILQRLRQIGHRWDRRALHQHGYDAYLQAESGSDLDHDGIGIIHDAAGARFALPEPVGSYDDDEDRRLFERGRDVRTKVFAKRDRIDVHEDALL